MNRNGGQVNLFGGGGRSDVNPNLLSNLIIMNQKFSEMDTKYLDKTEGDQFYINEPITENIDMKNKKIVSSAVPSDSHDLVNKHYVDESVRSLIADHSREEHDWIGQNYVSKDKLDAFVNKKYVDNKFVHNETLVHFQNRNAGTYATKAEIKNFAKKTDIGIYPFQNIKIEKMFMFCDIAFTYNPKVWISATALLGLFNSLNQKTMIFKEIMGKKVIASPAPLLKDRIENLAKGSFNGNADLSF